MNKYFWNKAWSNDNGSDIKIILPTNNDFIWHDVKFFLIIIKHSLHIGTSIEVIYHVLRKWKSEKSIDYMHRQ